MFASKVEATLRTAGHDVELVSSVEAVDGDGEGPDLVIADLGEIEASELTGRGLPVLGFYSHVEVETRRRAEAAGIDLIVPRSRMAREMPALVDSLLG
ncbi:MAG: hypothetical protein ACRDL3_06920 [Solirubrobacterales bacterium]